MQWTILEYIYTATNKSVVALSKALWIAHGLISITALLLKAPGKFVLVQAGYCHCVRDVLYHPSKIMWLGDSIFLGKYCILLYTVYTCKRCQILLSKISYLLYHSVPEGHKRYNLYISYKVIGWLILPMQFIQYEIHFQLN